MSVLREKASNTMVLSEDEVRDLDRKLAIADLGDLISAAKEQVFFLDRRAHGVLIAGKDGTAEEWRIRGLAATTVLALTAFELRRRFVDEYMVELRNEARGAA